MFFTLKVKQRAKTSEEQCFISKVAEKSFIRWQIQARNGNLISEVCSFEKSKPAACSNLRTGPEQKYHLGPCLKLVYNTVYSVVGKCTGLAGAWQILGDFLGD